MIDEKFIVVALLLNLLGSLSYARSTLQGRTKPNRVSWFLWALAPLVAFAAQLGDGVGLESAMTFMVGFGPLIVLTASYFSKQAYWRITRFDVMCGAISIIALVLWLITGTGWIAIVLSITADVLAAIPTIIKSYREPATENHKVYRNGALSAGITLLVIDNWQFANYGFALYILLICILLYVLVRFPASFRRSAQ